MKLKSLGVKEKPMEMAAPVSRQKPRIHYPTLSLSSKNIDGLSGLTIGQRVSVVLEAKVTGLDEGADWNTKEGVRVNFELQKGAIQPKKEAADMDEAVELAAADLKAERK
jgi:hypothetical protein